ncbi:MAG: hypothetical protein WCG27_11350, partial [Pseudomonadota bacterium]
RSQQLIRDYMARLVGENNITLGPIISDQAYLELKEYWSAWPKKWALPSVIAVIFLFWCLFATMFCQKIRQKSYLLQEFQRRQKVPLKTISVGLLFLLSFAWAATATWGNPQWVPLVILQVPFLILIALQSREVAWKGN